MIQFDVFKVRSEGQLTQNCLESLLKKISQLLLIQPSGILIPKGYWPEKLAEFKGLRL